MPDAVDMIKTHGREVIGSFGELIDIGGRRGMLLNVFSGHDMTLCRVAFSLELKHSFLAGRGGS